MAHLTTSTNFFNMLGHICKLQAHKSRDVSKTYLKQSILWANVTVKKVTSVEKVTYVTFLTVTFAHKIDCFEWVLVTSQLLCAWSLQMWPNILKKFVDVVKCAIWKKYESHFFHICESHLWFTFFLHLLHILSCRHTSLNGLLHIWDLIGLKITDVH